MRVVEQSGLEGLGDRRLVVSQDSGNQAHDGVGQHQRPQDAVGQDVVADRDLVVDKVIGHALVDTLVMPAEEDEMLRLGILADDRLLERPSLRGEEDHLGLRAAEFGQRLGDRFDLHHHAGAAAVGGVVDRAMAVMGPAPEVDSFQLHQTGLLGAAKDTLPEDALGDGGDGCQNLDLDHFEKLELNGG